MPVGLILEHLLCTLTPVAMCGNHQSHDQFINVKHVAKVVTSLVTSHDWPTNSPQLYLEVIYC